ncbi:DUF1302 family protein [Noviherbaspirillum sedimenti]|uniref:DUF1302 family protein n=2 Tax=Noviherbaspirillum sedimenti TaxID=2320865 RepID=A0A3A3G3M9_9BURK|nr:DUF1302 family protein [Noviherbaspirillum sedimenti]
MLVLGQAYAFSIDTGNDDLVINLDNTIRYNYGKRVAGIDLGGPASTGLRDESEFIFDKGDTILNRVDLFSEFDLSYKNIVGFRVSGSAWFDDAYGSFGKSNPAFAATANYPGNAFTPYVKRYYHGPSAEFNDAFVWANLPVPAGNANVKLGRFGLLWGEAVFGVASANSVAVSMTPGDGQKAAMSPGATAKETLLPLSRLSAVVPLSSALDVSLDYTLEYRASRSSEGGTFFALNDVVTFGPVRNGALLRQEPRENDKGDVSLMLRYQPQWANATLGLVYRRFDDKSLTYTQAGPGFYRLLANRDVQLLGVTANTNIAGAAVGAELSYRKGQGLAGGIDPVTLQPARGETIHGVLNAAKVFNQNALWSTAALQVELSWAHLAKITENAARYQGFAAACANEDITAGCPTKNAYHLSAAFSQSWQQVFPGVDLSLPIVYMIGLKGNAPTAGGAINEGTQILSVGLNAAIYAKHYVALTYTNFDNKHRGTGATYVNNGASANYDKDWLGLSYRYNF